MLHGNRACFVRHQSDAPGPAGRRFHADPRALGIVRGRLNVHDRIDGVGDDFLRVGGVVFVATTTTSGRRRRGIEPTSASASGAVGGAAYGRSSAFVKIEFFDGLEDRVVLDRDSPDHFRAGGGGSLGGAGGSGGGGRSIGTAGAVAVLTDGRRLTRFILRR